MRKFDNSKRYGFQSLNEYEFYIFVINGTVASFAEHQASVSTHRLSDRQQAKKLRNEGG